MTVYRSDGTLTEAPWPYRPGTWVCQVGPKIPNLTFTRDRDHLVINAVGDGVRLDRDTMRVIGAMMMQLASEIEADVTSRSLTPHQ